MTAAITREQAICMFYYVDFTEENVLKYTQKIDDLNEIEICYNTNPRQPVLATKQRILGDPVTWRSENQKYTECSLGYELRCFIVTKAQLKLFVEAVFFPEDPGSDILYEQRNLSTGDIYQAIQRQIDLLKKKSITSFTKWCSTNRLSYLLAKERRKSNVRLGSLYVMRKEYHGQPTIVIFAALLIQTITKHLLNYQSSINTMKDQGHEIIGYARKSPGIEPVEKRAQLLNKMAANLRKRSLDQGSRNIQTIGTCRQIHAGENNFCLATIDSAGLTSNPQDLKVFLEENPDVKKILVDTYALNSGAKILDTQDLLNNPMTLQKFSRTRLLQRSK
ncbi:hypothetical protein DFQ30_001474 [Apophysomyces sp. BC1015]|nr:hypothetical protein DFQ30_001474 [Apophysomyces sp. BC1015]